MLPDPKKVAGFIKDALFQSKEERQQEQEVNRDVKVKMAKARLRRHINQQTDMLVRLKGLAKRALSLNDEARFRQVGRQLLWTQKDIQRWEQYMLSIEILEARRDQVKASVELFSAVKAMGESLNELAAPGQVAELQKELEKGLARASTLDERMAVMMEALDTTLQGDMQVEDGDMEKLQQTLTGEVAGDEAAQFDREIEDGLRKIREELKTR